MRPAANDRSAAETIVVQTGLQYECQRCSTAIFSLFSDGHIACSDCGAAMNNLMTTFTGDKHGPRSAA